MEFLKNFFKSLSVGKILIIIAGILLILAATMHIFFPNADPYHPIYSLGTFLALLFGGFFAIGLLFVANGKFASIPAFAGSSIGLALFIGKVWIYVSDAIVGIDATWEAPFFVTLIPIVVALLLSIVGFVLVNPVKKAIPVTIVTVMGLLFPLLLSAGGIANDPSAQAQINRALGTSTTVMETIGDSSSIDTEYYKSKYKDIPALLQAGQKQCEEVAAEGFVLLKNDGALPMAKGSKMSLFSSSVADPVYGGTGSGSVDTSTAPNMKTAMEKDGNFSVNPTLWDYYDTGAGAAYRRTQGSVGAGVKGPRTIGDAPWTEVDSANGSTFAQYGDVALFMISRVGGEGSDSPRGSHSLNKLTDSDGTGGDSTNGEYLALSPVEKGVLEGLKAKKDAGVIKKVVVILNFANQVEASFIDNVQYGVDAAIWIGTPGSYGFNALSDILVGKINPSGHLSATFWADHHQNPALTNFGPKVYQGSPNNGLLDSGALNQDRVYTVYQEGIYLGYHYTESRYEDYVAGRANVGEFDYKKVVSYPFGYGLSYTDFEYSNLKVDKTGHGVHTSYEVSVDVKNVGEVAGKDAVEIYLDKPYTDYNVTHEIEASASELVGFAKTKLLGKNESETVKINVPERLFASYDDKDAGTYIITGGDYYLSIGHDCHNAINNALSAKGYSTTGRMDAPGAANLAHKVSLSEDKVSYATHPVTGAPVANLFQDCDYNNYENRVSGDKVQYITRNNWKDTVHLNWSDHVVLKYNDKLDEDLDKYGQQGEVKLPEDTSAYPKMGLGGSLQLISLRENDQGEPIAYDDPLWDEFLSQLSWEEMVECIRAGMRSSGAIENYGKPLNTDQNGPNGCTEKFNYNKSSKVGLFWKNYEDSAPEGSLRPTCYPSAGVRASTWNKDISFKTGDQIGDDALWVGYNGLYGPGSNIQRTPYGGRNYEYYSEDPVLSGEICGYECAAMENRGLYVYNKHFALNEIEDMRRGIQTWADEQTIREIYLRAFELPINMVGQKYNFEGKEITLKGASGVMIAMNRVGLYWTGIRKNFMTDWLRKEVGMTGIAVTDMWFGDSTPYLNFAAMLAAGTNLIDGGRKATDLDAAKQNHADVAWGLREALHRICFTTVHSNAMNGYASNIRIRKVNTWWQNAILAAQISTGVILGAGLVWSGLIAVKNLKKKEA